MDVNQIKQQFPGYAGWNDQAAILADFRATGGAGKGGPTSSSSTSSTPDYSALARQSLQLQQEANKPAVESLQASIPEIQKSTQIAKSTLEASKAPLTERYKSIIDQLKGREVTETTAQQTALSQEYGKRGIPLQSGAFQQDLLRKTQQISQNYGGAIKDVGLSQEQDLIDITNKIAQLDLDEVEKTRAIQNAIAQIQAGASSSAISNALTLYQQQQTANQATTTENRLQQAQTLAEKVASKPSTQVIEVGGRKKLINSETGVVIQDLGSTAISTGADDVAKLVSIFGGGINSLNLFSSATGQTNSKPALNTFLIK